MNTASIIISWILSAPLFFVGIISVGWMVAGWIFYKPTREFRLAASPILGAAVASVWLDIASRTISWEFATVTLWLVGGAAIFLVYRNLFFRPRLGWVLLAAMLLALAFAGGVLDDAGHFAIASIIANGVWPVPDFFSPDRPLLYHYGFDIVVAGLARFGWPVPFASDMLTATLQMSLVALVWQTMRQMLGGTLKTALGTLLALMTSTLGWIVRPFRSLLPDALNPIYPFIGTLFTHPLFVLTYTKSTLIATGLTILGLAAALLKTPVNAKRLIWIFPVLLAALALSDETYVLTVIPFAVLGLMWGARSWRDRGAVFFSSLIGLGITLTRGGLMRDLVFRFIGVSSEFGAGYTSVLVRKTLVWQTYGDPIHLADPLGLLRFTLELAAPITLAVFSFWAWRHFKDPVIRGALAGALVAWLVPFVFIYPAYENQIIRFWVPALAITGSLGAIMFLKIVKLRVASVILVIIMTLGGAADIFLINLAPTYWAANPQPVIYYTALWGAFFDPATRLPPGSVVWTDVLRKPKRVPLQFRGLPLVFGVPTQACYDILIDTTSPVCDNFWREPNRDTLRALGATHLVLTEAYARNHEDDNWFGNLVFIKRFDPPWWSRRLPRAWWEGRETPLYLYRVLQEKTERDKL